MKIRIENDHEMDEILKQFGATLEECEESIGFGIYFLEADKFGDTLYNITLTC